MNYGFKVNEFKAINTVDQIKRLQDVSTCTSKMSIFCFNYLTTTSLKVNQLPL